MQKRLNGIVFCFILTAGAVGMSRNPGHGKGNHHEEHQFYLNFTLLFS